MVRTGKDCFGATRHLRAALLSSSALALAWTLPAGSARAQDATWLTSPGSNIYNTGSNWSTGSVPTGTAYFGTSSQTNLTLATAVSVGKWYFNVGASSYTFNIPNGSGLSFTDGGMALWGGSSTINNSGALNFYNSSVSQGTIINNNFLTFWGMSAAGQGTITNNYILSFNGNSFSGGTTIINNHAMAYQETSFAGYGTGLTNNSYLEFRNTARAGNGSSITNSAGADLYFKASSRADGGSTIANSGNLYFSEGSTAGNASITNNSQLYFSDASKAGSASITNSAGAVVNFSNTSTADNAAITNDGIVDFSPSAGVNNDHKLSAGSIAGAGQYFLGSNELTVGSNNLSTTVTGVIADGGSAGGTGGSLVKVGTGVLALAGTNTYTGGTTINGGTLSVSGDANLGDAAGALTFNGGTLQITGTSFHSTARAINWGAGGGGFDIADSANTFTVSQSLGGAGGLTKLGAGTLVLSGTNTYGGGTTIAAGTLQVGNGGTTGWIVGNVVNDSVLAFNRSDTITFAGEISGSGAVQKLGSNTTILTGNNSYTGTTTVAAGTLQIGNGGTTGSIAGNVVNDGVLTIDRSDAVTLPGDISGSGSLRQVGSGTTILTGSNSYTGGTTIAAGTLQIGNGGTTGSIVGDVANDGVLAFNRSNTLTLAVNISGSGSVQQVGSGTTILTGTNTYSGDTIVSGGRLQFGDGSASGSTNLAGNINVTGGTLAIQAPATLNVAQTVTFGNNTALSIVAGTNSPALSADGVTIGNGVAFNVSGINDASQLDKVLIDTRSGISGDFANVTIGGFSGTVDYLTMSVRKSADSLQYLASYGLSWTAGNSLAHGTFTLTNASDSFTVGAALTDQAANPATGWDGKSLTKAGAGTLILTGQNTYSGGTTVSGGTLQIGSGGATGSILGTVTVNSGATFEVVNADTSGITNLANGGLTNFRNSSNAGNANVANTGQLNFHDTSTGGTATITNDGNLTFNNSSNAGSAAITNNSNLYFWHSASAGSALIDNLGTTNFNDTSSAGTATINNTSGATLAFNGSSTASGANISNSANLNFNNSASAGSAAITNAGTLEFKDVATAANAQITTTGLTNFRNTSSAGNATLTVNGSYYSYVNFYDTSTAGSATINVDIANLYFRDTSTAGNATIVNNGGLITWNSATLGNATITNNQGLFLEDSSSAGNATITNNDRIYFYYSSTAGTATIANNHSLNFWGDSSAGSARITNAAAGTLEIVNSSTLANATVINSGQMSFWGGNFGDVPTAGNATITNNASGTIEFRNSGTAGSATITNNGQMRFTSASTAGSATIINNSQLSFDTNTTAGSAAIVNSGNVLFDGNSTPGNAQLVNAAPGAVFDLSMTTGPNGDNRLTAGSLAGSGTFQLGGKELTVGSNNLSTTVTGVLTDGGSGGYTGASLVKVGTGRLTLSGVNTYTGATTVDGGTLAVNGDITASSGVTVNAGGFLGGTGIVGNTAIASGGALAPGNSVGTLTVSGNLTFSAGSSYTVEVSTNGADRTNVTGTATLAGATVQAVAIPGSFRGQTFTLLNAAGGFGGTQFAGLSIAGTFSPARNPRLTYDLNNVYLVLDPGTIMLPPGTSGNQTNVAGGINNAVNSGATPPAGFDTLLNMSGAQLNRALSEVSGQPGAASTQAGFNAMQQFMDMLEPFNGGTDGGRGTDAADGGVLGYAATGESDARVREAYAAVTPVDASSDVIDRRWGVWASGYGGASTLNGNAAAGSSSTTSRIYGTAVGADYRLSPDTLLGFALGGAGFNFSVADALGSGRADVFQAGLYARHNFGPAYVSAALAYGWQDVTTDRTVTVSGTDKLTANFKASTFAGRLETGWRFVPAPAFGVTPYAAVQATSFHLPGYGETALVGSNQFALSYSAQDTSNVRSELGARTDQRFFVSDGLLTLRGRLAWAHDTNTNRFVNAAFQTLPGAAFTVSGAQPAADSALVGGRAEMKWRNGFSLAGTVEGEFSRSTQTYTGKGTVRYEW
ncbi:autotransporter-associated beta strand repeat-containing protein [Bradyrhizobium sp. CCGB20]|uniref:autotransporter-associated beta strand repeat-containing protein n=1 Tax=Bradyrhizobium sp. CCGB20 TaxID=2949633 RepID=UPI0020B40E5D|nr:autotransporter-associated beta strand repeat-containing protein [Bradyrhizobium sp. CCGB20]MCP3399085.1 autotransporter-associated beta strand repeat-containing protein [Bradyrhizobium sp. CCGB20]